MLQTLGFTAQVTTMLVAEHAALGAVGLVAGVAAAPLLAPPLLGVVPEVSAASVALPWGWSALIVVGIELSVALADQRPLRAGSGNWHRTAGQAVACVKSVPAGSVRGAR